MAGYKRDFEDDESDDESLSNISAKRTSEFEAANIDNFDLPWPELLTSVIGSEATKNGQSDPACFTNADLSNFDLATINSSTEVADVGRCIEEWVDTAIPSNATNENISSLPSVGSDKDGGRAADNSKKCFGMIHAMPARLLGNMQNIHEKLNTLREGETSICMQLSFAARFVFLVENMNQIGQLNEEITKTLLELQAINTIEFDALADVKDMRGCVKRAKRLQDAVIKVDINIYGDAGYREQVGKMLSKRKVYLQHTVHHRDDYEYDNPHMAIFNGLDQEDDPLPLSDDATNAVTSASTHDLIAKICNSETRDRGLEGLKHNVKVKTELLVHQDQAVEFMVQREDGPLPHDFRLWQATGNEQNSGFRHTITDSWTGAPPSETGGGILADDMGMGKSLSALSLITRNLTNGSQWAQEPVSRNVAENEEEIRSRATLVVVSSVLIMNGWIKEIDDHLDGSLKIVKHHGKGRQNRFSSLIDCDIVLTTYHTLAMERKTKTRPLKSIKWFRIILDEAHIIKRQATTLFAAVSELEARYRWCLSGTPIQNALTDLGSLLAFLRLDPLDRASMFRKHIVAPFSDDRAEATHRLKTLLNSVCLRRCIDRLHLPPKEEHICEVHLSDEEREHYNKTMEAMVHASAYGSRERYCDTPFGKFQIQLQLRIICNHGTFQQPFIWGRFDALTQTEDAITSMGSHGEVQCSGCNQSLPASRTNCVASQRVHLKQQILCDECNSQIPGGQHEISSRDRARPSNNKRQQYANIHMTSKTEFNASGYSSKLQALIKDVLVNFSLTKSIIFSCWTRSLNLVDLHLKRNGITTVRIDGDTEVGRRQSILNDFERNDESRVLLMTTGTGAYGLNLAVANRVFILEPQWNPSIENQAIARVQRFRQTRSVQVVRYVVRETVEEEIRKQQIKKERLAQSGF